MNTFLKILLVSVLVVIALKFSPIILLGALIGMLLAAVLGVLGFSLLAALLGVIIGFAVALAPIWIPVLMVVGLVSLFRKSNPTPPAVAA